MIEESRAVHKAAVASVGDLDLFGVAAYEGNGDRFIKGVLFWDAEIANKPFGEDVFDPEKEILSFFDDMRHIVIGAIAPVTHIDVLAAGKEGAGIRHTAESLEFIFHMDWLEQRGSIHVPVEIIERIDMEAVKALCGMAFGYEILIGGEFTAAEKRDSGAIGGNVAVAVGNLLLGRTEREIGIVE